MAIVTAYRIIFDIFEAYAHALCHCALTFLSYNNWNKTVTS